ncbi:serine/threonine-protein kinase NIM1 isoform X2 [Anabrus simplex]|uniref:serine/threonine-protein kinase NIM1 isoform X2 n=1 Tax=Anabrus simplex TaxID=316456 RepID=UPI0035A3AB02
MPTSRVHHFPNDPGDAAAGNATPFQKLLHAVHHDPRWMADVNLGKRVGFYRFRGDLGSGNFSQVKMAIHQLCKERVAVKILDKSKLDQKTRRMLEREIGTMEAIHHQNIIRLYEVVETYSKIHLVMEYASGGELFNRITSAGRIPEQDAKYLFAQVISAISYMHDRNFIHRDIKAENVFFAAPGLVKLGDFGFSTEISSEGILKQAPRERLTPSEVRDSEWLRGIPFPSSPGPSEKYSLFPTQLKETNSEISNLSSDNQASLDSVENGLARCAISSLEKQALEKLSELGITEDILAEHLDRGARSAVIGTYRIIIHRLQRQDSLASEIEALVLTDMENNDSSSTLRSANASGNNFCVSALSRRSKSAGVKVRSDKKTNKNRSRTCILL